MSAIGTKRTYACALHMSAFGGKADMPLRHGNLSGAAFRAPNRDSAPDFLLSAKALSLAWNKNSVASFGHR